MQSSHALIDFVMKYPAESHSWHKDSNYLCQLSIENEHELEQLAIKCEQRGLKVVRFHEPDLDNQLTAISLISCEISRKITSSLPLMFKTSYCPA